MKKKLLLVIAVFIIAKTSFCSNIKIFDVFKPDTNISTNAIKVDGITDTINNNVIHVDLLCNYTKDGLLNDTQERYAVISQMMKDAGTNIKDPDRNKKLQAWWLKNYSKVICKDIDDKDFGGMLRVAVQSNFEEFLHAIAGPKSIFNLDLNVKDPVDGLTIIDWIDKQLLEDEYLADNGYTSLADRTKNAYKHIREMLIKYGARTTKQLKEEGVR